MIAKRVIRSLCATACVVVFCSPAAALDADKPLTAYTHTVWTRKDGIPAAFIYSLTQTRDGYLWMATIDGLVRFDGVRFLHWRPATGHTALLGAVKSLFAARDGTLWIGTAEGLVGHIRGDNLTTVSVGAQPEGLLEDRDGTLWVATENRVWRFRAETQERIGNAILLPGPFVSGPFQDNHGAIWFSADTGVVRIGPRDRERFVKIQDGKFWLYANAGEVNWISRKTLNIQTVLRDSKGHTWIGTRGQGLTRIRQGAHGAEHVESFAPSDGLSADSVWCLFEDREQNVWVGTQNGLNRFATRKSAR